MGAERWATRQTGESHSHPDNAGFSGKDIQRGHPNGTVIKYDPSSGQQTTFAPGEPR